MALAQEHHNRHHHHELELALNDDETCSCTMCLVFGMSGFTGDEFAHCKDCKDALKSAEKFNELPDEEKVECVCGQCSESCSDMESNPNCKSLCGPCADVPLADERYMTTLHNRIGAAKHNYHNDHHNAMSLEVDDETCSCTMCLVFGYSGFTGNEFDYCKNCGNIYDYVDEFDKRTPEEQFNCYCDQCDVTCEDMGVGKCEDMCRKCEMRESNLRSRQPIESIGEKVRKALVKYHSK